MINRTIPQEEEFQKWNENPKEFVFVRNAGYVIKCIRRTKFREFMFFGKLPNCWHEVILPFHPVRPYIDCEEYHVNEYAITQNKVEKVIHAIEERFLQVYQRPIGRHIWIEGSRLPQKFSVHVVWPDERFDTAGDWMRFIISVAHGLNLGSFLDLKVYSSNGPKNMRLAYCMKPDEPDSLLVPRGASRRLEDWDLFLSCCISVGIAPCPPDVEFLRYGERIPICTRPRQQYTGELKQLMEYIQCAYGDYKVTSEVMKHGKHGWRFYIAPSLFCERKYHDHRQGFHKSNRMYIGSDDGIHVYFFCLDQECCYRKYLVEDFTFLLQG